MTRGQMRTMLRRRLQEVTAAQWTDATLNTYLGLGLYYMEGVVLKIDPEAFIYTDTQDSVVSQSDYPIPANFMYEVGVYRLVSGEYIWMDKIPMTNIRRNTSTEYTNPYDTGYGRRGRYIVVYPTPSVATGDYLKVEYVPWLSMGDDDDVPDLSIGLHEGIVYRAEMIALGDTAQEALRAKEDLEKLEANVTAFYKPSMGRDMVTMEDVSSFEVE